MKNGRIEKPKGDTSFKRRAGNGSAATKAASAAAIRVLIAEDHTVVRDGLVSIINRQADMKIVGEAGNGRHVVEMWRQHRPDVTLMDLRMPELDGVSAIYEIRAIDPNARIIVLTTYDGDEDIYRGMRAGAKSYLLKDVRREELFQCIRAVHGGQAFLPPAVAAKLAERMPAEELTPRELEVLRLLASGKPNKLIGADLAITEVTVKSHVQSVFRKLNVLSRTEAIAVANRRGLIRV
ncbi:MAG TPA: response regulator transcription factor [Verrucomicrobiota bacterium]|nr:response regulator transcription factor [Verrucomicrobiota bacterium]